MNIALIVVVGFILGSFMIGGIGWFTSTKIMKWFAFIVIMTFLVLAWLFGWNDIVKQKERDKIVARQREIIEKRFEKDRPKVKKFIERTIKERENQ